jgi:hypothetical protein
LRESKAITSAAKKKEAKKAEKPGKSKAITPALLLT